MTRSLLSSCGVVYIDHIAVTTPDFDKTVAEYLSLPGSRLLKGPGNNPTQKVRYAFVLLDRGMVIEILGVGEDSPIERHVRQGGGPYHFCYAVEDIDRSVAQARMSGARIVADPAEDVAFDGRRVAFLFHDSLGLFELVEASPVMPNSPWLKSAEADIISQGTRPICQQFREDRMKQKRSYMNCSGRYFLTSIMQRSKVHRLENRINGIRFSISG
jgi:catechol 2,3-dioxygenase-like lactoylglutathione lyase family enzyme